MGYENVYFSILEKIKKGSNPNQISKELGKSKQALNRYIATLKREGCIKKIGYGCWEFIKDFDVKQVNKTAVIGRNDSDKMFTSLRPDMVRGHGFLINFRVPRNLKNWSKREIILKKLKVIYKPYYVGGIERGQTITFRNKKVHLTNKSIIFNFQESYLSETALEVRKTLIFDVLRLIRGLEAILRADFKINAQYIFKVSRQHYALVKNALAKQYDKEGKKLEVYSYKGLWMIIDNSLNLHELETLHKETALIDNLAIQNFFNYLKDNPVFVSDIGERIAELQGFMSQTLELQKQQAQISQKNAQDIQKIINYLRQKDL